MEEVRNVHKRDIILTSIIILLPILLGIILWDRLPDRIATHFDADNVPNGWNSKVFTVFGIPCALLLMHVLYLIILLNNSKKPNVSRKVSGLMIWIMPVISVVTNNIILLKMRFQHIVKPFLIPHKLFFGDILNCADTCLTV